MRFILGLLVGYCIRGQKRRLAAVLATIAVICFIVLPAIALSKLALSVRRERMSRPPQTQVPALNGLTYTIAERKVHNSNLNIRVLATRYDLLVESDMIIYQTPQPGEFVDYGTAVGVIISKEDAGNKRQCP